MYLNCLEEVKNLTKELVSIPSIVKTSGETDCAKRIYEFYSELPYFKENPEYLIFQQTENDEIERHNTIAMVRGTKGNSKKTVILMGHLDTVGVDDFGILKEFAFDPDKLPALFRELNLGKK